MSEKKRLKQLVTAAGYTSVFDYAKNNKTSTGKAMSSTGIAYNLKHGCSLESLQNYAATLKATMVDVCDLFTNYNFRDHLKELGFEKRSDSGDKVEQYVANIEGVAMTVFVNDGEVALSSSIQDQSKGKGGRDYKLPFVPYMRQMTIDVIDALSKPTAYV